MSDSARFWIMLLLVAAVCAVVYVGQRNTESELQILHDRLATFERNGQPVSQPLPVEEPRQ